VVRWLSIETDRYVQFMSVSSINIYLDKRIWRNSGVINSFQDFLQSSKFVPLSGLIRQKIKHVNSYICCTLLLLLLLAYMWLILSSKGHSLILQFIRVKLFKQLYWRLTNSMWQSYSCEANSRSASWEIYRLLGNRKDHYHVQKAHHWTLSWVR
jgi:hypothetical protein